MAQNGFCGGCAVVRPVVRQGLVDHIDVHDCLGDWTTPLILTDALVGTKLDDPKFGTELVEGLRRLEQEDRDGLYTSLREQADRILDLHYAGRLFRARSARLSNF